MRRKHKDIPEGVSEAQLIESIRATQEHIWAVEAALDRFARELKVRAIRHDASKLEEPERSGFARLSTKLADVVYNSPEYHAALAEGQATITHHYATNDHHPEHHAAGIDDMDLLQIIEMFCDWRAASERTKHGSLHDSLAQNKARFAVSDQLARIFENTRIALGW